MTNSANTTQSPKRASLPTSAIDALLTAQLVIAWAGEAGEERRLGWWRSDLVSEFGGEDLFQRLLPHTWRWAVLQGAREAARRRDAELRAQTHDPDRVVTLFHLGFVLDERVEERLQELKRAGREPKEALPGLAEVFGESWDRGRFTTWVQGHGAANYVAAPVGRQLKGAPPDSPELLVRQLVAALWPLGESYPLPHFRR